jgi:predicted CopG family antitoxin
MTAHNGTADTGNTSEASLRAEMLEATCDQLREQLAAAKDYFKTGSDSQVEIISELREQRDKLRATLIAVGRNLGGQISEQVSDGFLEHLAEESRLMAQKLAEESHAAKQFSEAVVRLTEQRDKLLEVVRAIQWCSTFQGMPSRCPVCGGFEKTGHGMSCDIGKAVLKATALPATPQLPKEPAQ